jgi:hypothetical protein
MRVMPASLQKFSNDHKIDPNHERPIQCPYCPQQYLLIWDDKEWNSVKDLIRLAEAAVRRSHRLHGDIDLAPTLKVVPTS